MTRHCNYECSKCGFDIEVEVVVNEEDDLPEACPECGEPIPDSAHEDVAEQAMGEP